MDRIIENSSKVLLLNERGQILLLRYQDSSEMGLGTWYSVPGGRQRYGETLTEAAVRECEEELGLIVTIGRLCFVREYIHSRHELKGLARDQHKVEFYFVGEVVERSENRKEERDTDQVGVGWYSLGDLRTLNVFPTGLRKLGDLQNGYHGEPYWGDAY